MKRIFRSLAVIALVVVVGVGLVGCVEKEYFGPDYFKVFKSLGNFRIEYQYSKHSMNDSYIEVKVGNTVHIERVGYPLSIVKKADGRMAREVLGGISSRFCSLTDSFRWNMQKSALKPEYLGEEEYCGRVVKKYARTYIGNGLGNDNKEDWLIDKKYNVVLKYTLSFFDDAHKSSDIIFEVTRFEIGGQSLPTIEQ